MRKQREKPSASPPVAVAASQTWYFLAGLGAALLCAFEIYSPGINGPFVFDDLTLPFSGQHAADLPFRAWLGVRLLLMITYWLNYRLSGESTFSYHVVNVLLHVANSFLVFLIARKFSDLASTRKTDPWRRDIVALFAAAIFLLHPVQTEAVTYIAGRSEGLSVLLFFSALTVFLYRGSAAVSWRVSIAILVLFAAAINTKEHTAVLPMVFLLTDYFWNPGFSLEGARRSWRLYVPLAIAGAAGIRFILRYLRDAPTIGFHLKDLPWNQYFFTQWRALFVYLRLFLFPVGQNVDYDFAISRTVFDHGAIVALIGLVLLLGAAIYYRREYRLASYGFILTLVLFAPTSSVVPIADPIVERRLYLPMLGLILILVEFIGRIHWQPKTMIVTLSSIALVAGFLTHERNEVWRTDIALEADAVLKAPRNPRAHEQLGFAYFFVGRCEEAAREYATAAQYMTPNYMLYLDWGVALDCNNQLVQALDKLRKAAAIVPTAQVYAAMGRVLSRQSKWDEALTLLDQAVKLDPTFARTYIYRGAIHQDTGQLEAARSDYRLALQYDPRNRNARDLLARLEAALGSRH